MIVQVQLIAGHAGGKTHLADALEKWLKEDYPNATHLDVQIVEAHPLPQYAGNNQERIFHVDPHGG